MKGVSCVNPLSSVQNVTNVPPVVPNLPVGARLHQFWKKWAALGVSPKVLAVLREDYILPFRFRPNLIRKPTVTSCHVNPHRNSYLLEALHQLLDKNAVELVQNPQSVGFYNWLFLVPKPNNWWRDLSILNNYLKTQSFKMETPETIRTSRQAGEWVTSIDFKDAYFHIPINSQSRKYMRFQVQDKIYQFKALPFGLSTAPMEFTVVAKVGWQALQKKIRDIMSSPVCPVFNVLDQFTNCHRETGTSGLFTYETHTVASQKQLESARDTGKDHPHSQLYPPTSKMVAGGKQCDHRSTITSTKTCSEDLYRCIKRRVDFKPFVPTLQSS